MVQRWQHGYDSGAKNLSVNKIDRLSLCPFLSSELENSQSRERQRQQLHGRSQSKQPFYQF